MWELNSKISSLHDPRKPPTPSLCLETTEFSNLGVPDFYYFYTKETQTLGFKITIVCSATIL